MTTTVSLKITFEALIEAISTLDLPEKHRLLEILEDQIFVTEEEALENAPDVLSDVEAARKAYEAGDYQTLQEYVASRTPQP